MDYKPYQYWAVYQSVDTVEFTSGIWSSATVPNSTFHKLYKQTNTKGNQREVSTTRLVYTIAIDAALKRYRSY